MRNIPRLAINLVLVLVFAFSGVPGQAREHDFTFVYPPTPQGMKDFTIDARNGDTEGAKRYKKSDRVRIVVFNKNPFRFSYKVTIEEKDVEETAITTFLGLLNLPGGLVSDQKTEEGKRAAGPINRAVARVAPPAAPGACADWVVVTAIHARLVQGKQPIEQDYEVLHRGYADVAAKYEAASTVLYDDQHGGREIYDQAKALQAVLQGTLPDLDSKANDVQTKVIESRATATAQKDLISQMQKSAACTPDPQHVDALNEYMIVATFMAGAWSQEIIDNLKKVSEGLGKLHKMEINIEDVLSNSNAFYETHERGQYDVRKNILIKVQRKDLQSDAGFGDYLSAELNFGGGPYFALSGGIAFARLEKREFQRVQGFELDRNGNLVLPSGGGSPQLTTVIGVKEDSSSRISPLVMLHGRLAGPYGPLSGIHASLGVTAKADSKGTDAEFLIGPSLSFLEENLFLTLGGYAGKKQTLQGSFFVGAKVPNDLAEIPVRKDYRWGFAFAITYRIPVGKK